MIYLFCEIHGMNGKFVGNKVFMLKGIKNTTITIHKCAYSNIIEIDGKLKKL